MNVTSSGGCIIAHFVLRSNNSYLLNGYTEVDDSTGETRHTIRTVRNAVHWSMPCETWSSQEEAARHILIDVATICSDAGMGPMVSSVLSVPHATQEMIETHKGQLSVLGFDDEAHAIRWAHELLTKSAKQLIEEYPSWIRVLNR